MLAPIQLASTTWRDKIANTHQPSRLGRRQPIEAPHLDKLIGAALRGGLDPAAAFVVITSRCSYEMVEKTAAAGVSMLVAISAPTALAVRKADECFMTLVALARLDGHAVFTRPDRVVDA